MFKGKPNIYEIVFGEFNFMKGDINSVEYRHFKSKYIISAKCAREMVEDDIKRGGAMGIMSDRDRQRQFENDLRNGKIKMYAGSVGHDDTSCSTSPTKINGKGDYCPTVEVLVRSYLDLPTVISLINHNITANVNMSYWGIWTL